MPSGIVLEDVRPSALTPVQLDALWDIHREYVERSRASFEAGLAGCDEIILLREAAGGPIRGFVVFNVVDVDVRGRNHVVILSRWGFLARSFRHRSVMQWVGIRAWLRQKRRRPFDPVYCAFTASTVNSYLYLVRSFVEAWPHRRGPTPPLYAELLDRTMRAIGERAWDPAAGRVIRNGEVRYLEGVVGKDVTSIDDPDVRFYHEQNPHQDRGDSLGCIAPATMAALVDYGRRTLRKRLSGARR